MAEIEKDEFERSYAERSGMTVEELRELGCRVVPCDCDYEGCQGWQMDTGSLETLADILIRRRSV